MYIDEEECRLSLNRVLCHANYFAMYANVYVVCYAMVYVSFNLRSHLISIVDFQNISDEGFGKGKG
jgi:hypothetical protein